MSRKVNSLISDDKAMKQEHKKYTQQAETLQAEHDLGVIHSDPSTQSRPPFLHNRAVSAWLLLGLESSLPDMPALSSGH